MTETLAHRYLSDSTQQEPYKEYQQDRVKTVLRNFSIFVLWTKVASAMEGLTHPYLEHTHILTHLDISGHLDILYIT